MRLVCPSPHHATGRVLQRYGSPGSKQCKIFTQLPCYRYLPRLGAKAKDGLHHDCLLFLAQMHLVRKARAELTLICMTGPTLSGPR